MINFYLKFLAIYYFIANINYVIFLLFSFKQSSFDEASANYSEFTNFPKVTVIIPAKNEEDFVLRAYQSVVLNYYPNIEIIIVNDGSTDSTFALLKKYLRLIILNKMDKHSLFKSSKFEDVFVINKVNSGKANSVNLALEYSTGEYFITLDSDTLLEKDAILFAVKKMISDPKAVAVGGVVRILNGAQTKNFTVHKGNLPTDHLAMFQVIEYIRAFYGGRLGLERIGGTTLLSGAFCLFKKDIVLKVGGFDSQSVTEDFEITLRLNKYLNDNKLGGTFHLLSIPSCWTVAPQTLKDLFFQRVRWQKGLIQTLWKYKNLIFNIKLKRMGIITLPQMLFFEALSPLVEVSALIVVPFAIYEHDISFKSVFAFMITGILFYLTVTLLSIRLEETHFARHPTPKSNARFVVYAILDNFGYRSFLFVARLWGTLTSFNIKYSWASHNRENADSFDNNKAA